MAAKKAKRKTVKRKPKKTARKPAKRAIKRKPAKRKAPPKAGRKRVTTPKKTIKKPTPAPTQPKPVHESGPYFPHKMERSAPMTIIIEEHHMVISETDCHCCGHNYFCTSDHECLSCGVRRGERLKPYKGW